MDIGGKQTVAADQRVWDTSRRGVGGQELSRLLAGPSRPLGSSGRGPRWAASPSLVVRSREEEAGSGPRWARTSPTLFFERLRAWGPAPHSTSPAVGLEGFGSASLNAGQRQHQYHDYSDPRRTRAKECWGLGATHHPQSTHAHTYTRVRTLMLPPQHTHIAHARSPPARRPAQDSTRPEQMAARCRGLGAVASTHPSLEGSVPPLAEGAGTETFPEGLCVLQAAQVHRARHGRWSQCGPGLAPGTVAGEGRGGGKGVGTHSPVSSLLPTGCLPETSPGWQRLRKAWKGARARVPRPRASGSLNPSLRQLTSGCVGPN